MFARLASNHHGSKGAHSQWLFRPGVRSVAGVVMMVAAVGWFFGAAEVGYLFWFPPVLFAGGVWAIVKDLGGYHD